MGVSRQQEVQHYLKTDYKQMIHIYIIIITLIIYLKFVCYKLNSRQLNNSVQYNHRFTYICVYICSSFVL